MKILVGSKNPVKIEAVTEAFSKYYDNVEVTGIKVNSNVSNQPINDETFEGAKNRAIELLKVNKAKNLASEFFVGIEGGILNRYSKWFAFGGMCILDVNERISFGTSPHFELPASIVQELLKGFELGQIIDKISGSYNSKQKGGAIGYFTKNVMNRKDIYVQGLIAALIPFVNESLFFSKQSATTRGESFSKINSTM